MGIKFSYLAAISELPLPDPQLDEQSGSIVFEQRLADRFRRRAIILSVVLVLICTLLLYFLFPYIVGTKTLGPSSKNGQLLSLFYVSIVAVPYFGWWAARLLTSRDYIRRIVISKSAQYHINNQPIKAPQLKRGRVLITCSKQERKIEAIWIQSSRHSFLIAAKDLPEDLDAIEAMIPQPLTYVDTEHKVKGVL